MKENQLAITKSNPLARGAKQKDKTFNGKVSKPGKYIGTWLGDGNYIAAQDEAGKLIKDSDGRPIPYGSI